MSNDILKEVDEKMSSKYFLIKKHSFIYFVGGFFAIVMAILGIGYQSINKVLDSEFSQKARNYIEAKQASILEKDNQIEQLITTLENTNQQMIQLKEDIKSNLSISNEPLKIPKPVSFNNNVFYTISYWSRGAKQAGPHYCTQPPKVPNGFEFVQKGTLSGGESPLCPIPAGHCNSIGEFCKNYRVSTACLINKQWHNWYKKYTKDNGLVYSIENVCRQPG